MLQLAVSLLQWLPWIFIWLVVPIAVLSTLMVPARKARARWLILLLAGAGAVALYLALAR